VRLAGGIPNGRLAGREHGGHDGVLGRHHARLVEEDRARAQAIRSHLVAAVDLDLDAELAERVDVRVEAAAADHVAAGRRHGRAAEAREQWAGEQERGADPAAQLRVELGLVRACGVDPDDVLADPLGVGADVGQDLDHRLDVADPGDVRQRDGLLGEQRRREDRQGAVLVPGGSDPSVQGPAALDDEGLHQGLGDGDLRHGR
jgi:hypothetical protein